MLELLKKRRAALVAKKTQARGVRARQAKEIHGLLVRYIKEGDVLKPYQLSGAYNDELSLAQVARDFKEQYDIIVMYEGTLRGWSVTLGWDE